MDSSKHLPTNPKNLLFPKFYQPRKYNPSTLPTQKFYRPRKRIRSDSLSPDLLKNKDGVGLVVPETESESDLGEIVPDTEDVEGLIAPDSEDDEGEVVPDSEERDDLPSPVNESAEISDCKVVEEKAWAPPPKSPELQAYWDKLYQWYFPMWDPSMR